MIAKTRERWYLKVLAGLYLIVCGACSIRYLVSALSPAGPYVPWVVQGLCFGGVLAAALYLLWPRIGWRGLLAITVAAIFCAAGDGQFHAVAFHAAIFVILLLPWLRSARGVPLAGN